MTRLTRIVVYPIKSLDGVSVESSNVLASGALSLDRRYALVDSEGRYINGKRFAAIHHIRSRFDIAQQRVHLSHTTAGPAEFRLPDESGELSNWVTGALGVACRLIENMAQGFPDDTEAVGPTLISTATLRAFAGWFDGLSLDEARLRFRANLEVDAPAAYWEDRLVAAGGFRLGESRWNATGVCQRCVVPSRQPQTAESIPRFAKRFSELREQTLPDWSPRDRFDHFYRLAVNTRLAPGCVATELQVGDALSFD
ncbi:MAG: MOSC N-terminal beta barrel domain-containing protein [Planctomycetota bacterium]